MTSIFSTTVPIATNVANFTAINKAINKTTGALH
jgi:hypothetical protein